jgi:chemotaxis protein CheD
MTVPARNTAPPTGPAHRHREPGSSRWVTRILPGECYVTSTDEVLSTVLGSCVSACIRDPAAGVGGMNHFLLPVEPGDHGANVSGPLGLATRFGGHAMETLINELMKRGASRSRLEIKLFGGGKIMQGTIDVGQRNIHFVHEFLRMDGLRAAAHDLGGDCPRTVNYEPSSGRARVKRLQPLEARTIEQREREYLQKVDQTTAQGGDIELFG